jgi:DNA-binding NarL/FixJ family response regulator
VGPPIRIIIADDHALFRQGLRSLLALQPDITVVAESDRVDDLPAILSSTPCDLLLLDLGMERNSLVDIAALSAQVEVLVVTASEHPHEGLQAIRAGARGLVLKRFAIETLMDAIHAVAAGHVWMPPSHQAQLAAHVREPGPNLLTRREREIIRQVALGLRNSEVAQRLFISEQTVKTHLNNIFQKLEIRDRVELTLYAARVGIIGVHERRS